jgi:Integrase core domain
VLPRPLEPGQYLAIRYADALSAAGAVASVGSVGDSYDNALAESTIGQLTAELVHRRGPWRTIEQLELALFEYLDWWNHRRLHGEIGMTTPVEKETVYYHQTRPLETAGSQSTESLPNPGRFTLPGRKPLARRRLQRLQFRFIVRRSDVLHGPRPAPVGIHNLHRGRPRRGPHGAHIGHRSRAYEPA